MKQNITLAIEKPLLTRARAIAAQRGTSISGLMTEELGKLINREEEFARARARALAHLENPLPLGGKGITNREALHDRQGLR